VRLRECAREGDGGRERVRERASERERARESEQEREIEKEREWVSQLCGSFRRVLRCARKSQKVCVK